MSGSISIASGSESDLQSAVASMGPIAVAVDASSNAFRVCLRVPFHNLECTHTSLAAIQCIMYYVSLCTQ